VLSLGGNSPRIRHAPSVVGMMGEIILDGLPSKIAELVVVPKRNNVSPGLATVPRRV
jgi:hypothetical protein